MAVFFLFVTNPRQYMMFIKHYGISIPEISPIVVFHIIYVWNKVNVTESTDNQHTHICSLWFIWLNLSPWRSWYFCFYKNQKYNNMCVIFLQTLFTDLFFQMLKSYFFWLDLWMHYSNSSLDNTYIILETFQSSFYWIFTLTSS